MLIVAPIKYNFNFAHLDSQEPIRYTTDPDKNQNGSKFI